MPTSVCNVRHACVHAYKGAESRPSLQQQEPDDDMVEASEDHSAVCARIVACLHPHSAEPARMPLFQTAGGSLQQQLAEAHWDDHHQQLTALTGSQALRKAQHIQRLQHQASQLHADQERVIKSVSESLTAVFKEMEYPTFPRRHDSDENYCKRMVLSSTHIPNDGSVPHSTVIVSDAIISVKVQAEQVWTDHYRTFKTSVLAWGEPSLSI